MNRYSASATHFAISVTLGLVLFSCFWFVVYPSPMLLAIGGHEIFLLILGIDVVLGPLLTLVVFKAGKKSLKFDLATIAVMQIAAMAYGVSVLHEGRPAYVSALGDKFQVVQAVEVTDENLTKSGQALPLFAPKWVGTKAPEGRELTEAVGFVQEVGGGRGHFPQLHIPYEAMAKDVLAKSLPISTLIVANAGKADEIRAWLKGRNHDENSTRYQPIKISASEFAVILDGKSGAVVGIAPFRP